MADYTPLVDYAGKDALAATDPNRLIRGKELQRDFDSIETAVNSKLDSNFVLPEIVADIPRFFAATKTAASGDVVFNTQNSTKTPAGWKFTFQPLRETSKVLVKYQVVVDVNTTETNGVIQHDYEFQTRIRNLQTGIEVDLGSPSEHKSRYTIRQNNETIIITQEYETGLSLLATSNSSLQNLVGTSTLGYEVSLQITAGTFSDVQSLKTNAVVSVQEIFL